MASMDELFDNAAGMDMNTSPPWDGGTTDMNMFDIAADPADSFFDASQYLNIDGFGDSPAASMAPFIDSTSDFKFANTISPAPQSQGMLQPRTAASSSSPESSSQDSSSDSSSGNKKRKTSSEPSPTAVSDAMYMRAGNTWQKKEPRPTDAHNAFRDSLMGSNSATALADAEIESINKSMAGPFPNFGSAASSPGLFGNGIHDQASPNHISQSTSHTMMDSVPSVATVRPAATFSFGSREQSPASAAVTHSHEGSPTALFNFAPESPEALFQPQTMWNGTPQNQAWPNTIQMSGVEISPSPTAHQSMVHYPPHPSTHPHPKCQLTIDPISDKSRVETQINVRLTLWPMPHGITKLHLPRCTISKPKLLAKEEELGLSADTLELHTMLVCTSAMEKPGLLDRAKLRALEKAQGIKSSIPKKEARRSSTGAVEDDSDDPDKPSNGGEVRICENCMQRERKRAARKRVKKSEDETEWYQYEQDRVIVFNTNEFKDWQQPGSSKDNPNELPQVPAGAGAMQISAPMRIACYCRHQNEKSGFRVIFTITDSERRFIAQGITSSISITDDHKTKEPHHQTARVLHVPDGPSQSFYPPSLATANQGDMHTTLLQRNHYSTNDLPAMQQQYQHAPFMRANGLPHTAGNIVSQPASATITPHSRSRQASPSVQLGPNKKRKNSSVHRLPHSLTMTRADVPQPLTMPSASTTSIPSASAAPGPQTFSPTARTFMNGTDLGYGLPTGPVPNVMSGGPTTPNSNSGLITPSQRSTSLENIPYHFYSVPNSAHPSRAPSPISSSRMPMNVMPQAQSVSANNLSMNTAMTMPYASETQARRGRPIIHKILPPEGPIDGGIEVTVLGRHFQRDMQVMFGDNTATTTTFWAENTLVCLLPPATVPGIVPVTFTHELQSGYPPANSTTFRYIDNSQERLFELAFRVMCQKGNVVGSGSQNYAEVAQQLLGDHGVWAPTSQGHSTMHFSQVSNFVASLGHAETEDALLKFLDVIDLDNSPQEPDFDLPTRTGTTMLSLASSLGYERFAAGLLARGANPNVCDVGGFTPLMKAVMRNRLHLVRRLITKGADPFMRTARGQRAIDYTTSNEVFTFLRLAQRNARPRSISGTPFRSRTSSVVATRPVWAPSSPSQSSNTGYEGEFEQSDDSDLSDGPDPWTLSRRSSANWDVSRRGSHLLLAKDLHPLAAPVVAGGVPQFAPAAAASMSAWRDQLAAQIAQLQQTYQRNFPNSFQFRGLPPMPQIPDYQAYPLVRRISSLLPQHSLLRSEPSPSASEAPSAPPAYDEIYPEKRDVELDSKEKMATLHAVAEAALDHVATQTFDQTHAEGSSSAATLKGKGKLNLRIGKKALTKEQQELLRRTHAERMKKLGSDGRLFFIWIPILLIVLALMLRGQTPTFSSWSPFAASPEQPTSQRIAAL